MAAGDIEIYESVISESDISTALTGEGLTADDNIVAVTRNNVVWFVVVKAA